MRKLRPFAYLALVALLFFAGDRLGALALGQAVEKSEFRFARLYRGGLENDVLIVGDSRAVHSVFAPELSKELGLRVFNLGFNGMSGEITEAVIDDYLAHNPPPKAVVIEVSNVADAPNLTSEMRLFARYPGHVRQLVRQLDPWEAVWSRISHLYDFNNEMTLRSLYYLVHSDQDWIMYDKPMTSDVIRHIPLEKYREYHFRQEGIAAIRRLTQTLKARGIEPLVYIAPFHPYFHQVVPKYAQLVAQLQQELGPDEAILDLSQSVTDNADFSDLLHTNLKGSEAVMAVLAERLRQVLSERTATENALGSKLGALVGNAEAGKR